MKQIANRTALVVTPKEPFIKWVQSADETSAHITPEEIMEGPNVYLVDDTIDGMGEERLLKKNFAGIFEEKLNGWIIDETMWPQKRDLKTFHQWFHVHVYAIVLDMGTNPLEIEEY